MKTLSDAALEALTIMTFNISDDVCDETYNAVMQQIIGTATEAGLRIQTMRRGSGVTFIQIGK